MAAANVNEPDFVLAAANAMEAAVEADLAAQRNLMAASFGAFGYNPATSVAVVTSLNLREPKDLYTMADKSFDSLAGLLLRRHQYRANAGANAIIIPLTVADDLRA